ncbi:hypothetical protein ACVENA_01240 [Sphingopyxis sp. 550A]
MARFHTLVGLGLASVMMIGTPVFASTPSASTTTSKPATKLAAKPAAKPATRAQAKPAAKLAATPARATPARATPARSGGRMVRAKLSNGKTVTYDCSLAGNKTKQACKG